MYLLFKTVRMKKPLLIVSAVMLLLAAGRKAITARSPHPLYTQELSWSKSKTGVWLGMADNKLHWYKLDKSARLWASADGKEWQEVTEGLWQDKEGRQLKIGEGRLWWTSDEGKNFMEVPEWKWKGPKGEWYKFDAKWTLWVVK